MLMLMMGLCLLPLAVATTSLAATLSRAPSIIVAMGRLVHISTSNTCAQINGLYIGNPRSGSHYWLRLEALLLFFEPWLFFDRVLIRLEDTLVF